MPAPAGRDAGDAYDLVDRLPPGRARAAAWNAYVCQTYADKLAEARRGYSDETARVERSLYALALAWLERADTGSDGELSLPPWGSPIRSRDQLSGMRQTLDALRTHVAYGLPETFRPQLAAVDARIDAVERLWIERPPPELRGGLGDALTAGLRDTIALGRELALGSAT